MKDGIHTFESLLLLKYVRCVKNELSSVLDRNSLQLFVQATFQSPPTDVLGTRPRRTVRRAESLPAASRLRVNMIRPDNTFKNRDFMLFLMVFERILYYEHNIAIFIDPQRVQGHWSAIFSPHYQPKSDSISM